MRRWFAASILAGLLVASFQLHTDAADLVSFSVTANGTVSVTLPRFTVCAKLVDSGDQRVVLADFTGANCGTWPGVLATLTNAQLLYLRDQQLLQILRWKAGLDTNVP